MSKRDYTALSYEEKRELLRLNGSFLAERSSSSRGKRAIYALYGFFVELDYDSKNQEKFIRVFNSYFDTREDTRLEGILINLN